MTYLREILWNIRSIALFINVTRLVLSETSVSSYRYVSLRFSAWIRILQKKGSCLERSRLDFSSRPVFFRYENTRSPHLFDPLEQKSWNTKRDLFVHFARKARTAWRRCPCDHWRKSLGIVGVTCPFAVDQLSLWDQGITLSACFPLSAFLATLQRADP